MEDAEILALSPEFAHLYESCSFEQTKEDDELRANFLDCVLALSTARQQLAQREAEVAEAVAIIKAMSPKHSIMCPANIGSKICKCDSNATNEWINGQLGDLPKKAEAFKAKVWNEAVRAAINHTLDYQYKNVTNMLNELLKPESEVV